MNPLTPCISGVDPGLHGGIAVLDQAGELVTVADLVDKDDIDTEDFDDDYGDFDGDDDNSMVMNLKNAADCIGCEACSKVCPKNCFTHQPKSI